MLSHLFVYSYTSRSTSVESLLVFVEKELYKLAEDLPSRIKDTIDMLNIIDNLNNNCIPENTFLISFDVANMFPSVHNESGIKSVESLLSTRSILNLPNLCFLKLCIYVWNVIALYLIISSIYKQMGQHKAPIYLALIVTLPWKCMIRKQWTTHSNI